MSRSSPVYRALFLGGGWLMLLAVGSVPASPSAAAEPATAAANSYRQAVKRGVALVEQAAARYPEHRQCFSCHHQTLPLLAMTAARQRGVKIDNEILKSQDAFTHASFAGRLDSLKEGTGIGGRSMTVAYGLWTFSIVERPADEVTAAMVGYLLKNQKEDGHWAMQTMRPPLEESHLMCSVLAMYGLRQYAGDQQRDEAEAAIARGQKWLESADAVSQEDRVARLWGLHLFGGSEDAREAALHAILDKQRDDGSWGQLDDMPGDAYATGLTLSLLSETGFDVLDKAYCRGCEFLLKAQQQDGSWLVETRSKPVQVYFDNGDPHGKHQFISTAASSWAVAALAAGAKTATASNQQKAPSCRD
jgi:N-acyl-D-amino-acid deacylase